RLTAQLLRPDCPVPPKGWLFVGAPNCGKTTVAKAIAADHGLPLILGDLPALKAKHVGESEGRVRSFTALCEAMAPCCVLLDDGWAPGNIEVCCQRAVQYQVALAEAAGYVRPTTPEDIERLRDWASGRCLNAAAPGFYRRTHEEPIRPSRRVQRGGPSNN